MRHQTQTQRFSRNPNHRNMLFKQLVTSVIEHGRIQTTLERAKAIRGLVDQVIGYAKEGSLHSQRQARRIIKSKVAFNRLFTNVREDFLKLSNKGGYSRIFRLGYRRGDNAPLAILELLNFVPKVKTESGEKKSEKKSEKGADKKAKVKAASGDKKLDKTKAKTEKEKTADAPKAKKAKAPKSD